MTDVPTTTTTTTNSTTRSLPIAEDYTQIDDDNSNNNTQQQNVSPKSPAPVSSMRSLRRSLSQSKRNKKLIVFASASKYQWLMALIVVAPLLAILISIILFDVQSQEEYKNSSTIWVLGWCFIFVMVLYMAVLPRQVDVRSNGTVAIKTCLLTFFINDIARAYRGCSIIGSNRDSILRPRVVLATNLEKDGVVVIRRHHGKWDVIVTPEDPEGFVHAIEEMVRQKEDESDKNVVPIVGQHNKRKPNLSSTISAQQV